MLLGLALILLVILGIIMGVIMMGDNKLESHVGFGLIVILISGVGGFIFVHIDDVSKKYALELYSQNKPVTVRQAKYIVKSEEYSNDKPIIFLSKDGE